MKKFYYRNLAYGAAALLIGAVGFTGCSSEDELANTNPTYDGKSVKTQFAINIPYGSKNTRMTADNTQNNDNFLGMTNVRLLSFDGEPGTGTGAATTFSSMIPLTDINGITAEASNKVYNDVNVPVGTDHFLFYASAPMGTDASSKFAQGSIIPTLDGKTTLSDINFKLETVDTKDKTKESSLTEVLNSVASVSNWSSGEGVDENLKALYASFITLKAGSANSIKLALQNLYNQVESWAKGSEDNVNTQVANDIRKAIVENGTFRVSGQSAPYTLQTDLTYPDDRNLPDGAVQLSFSGTEFTYDATSSLTGFTSLDVSKVCFPAALYYFVNTDVATSDAEYTSWPTTPSTWTGAFDSWGSEVLPTTRTIALKKNIQYAVANMKLTVKCATSSLKDRGTENNPAVSVTVPTKGFKVTGVLIGGQPSLVDWKLEPTQEGNNKSQFDYTVYDKVAEGVNAKAGTAEGENYTLLLSDTTETAQKVNFAIELQNNSDVEFRGVDGVVPAGGKFYLVGQLDPASYKTGTKPSYVTNPHVFMADYQTVVNATISTLANAYNTIPDLRATKMQLGLSVDLEWKTGLTFDVTIGGDGQ